MKPSANFSTYLFCLLGFAFSLWVWSGAGEEVCFTAGCSLYQSSSVAGISLWLVGMAAFAGLALLCLARHVRLAYALVTLGIVADSFLLALLLLTAPCFNCLVFALLLFCVFWTLRKALLERSRHEHRSSWLVFVWAFFFICNTGIVLKSAIPLYDISDNAEDASVSLFFSPSCSACSQAVASLSGNIDVAFYPVAESSWDVARIAHIQQSLAGGANMEEAFVASRQVAKPELADLLTPSMLFLRLKLLCNMAHVYVNGGKVVPYLEYRGLPSFLARKKEKKPAARSGGEVAPAPQTPASSLPPSWTSDPGRTDLPLNTSIAGACRGDAPCDDDNGEFMRRPRPGQR